MGGRLFEDPPYRPQLTDKQIAKLRAVYDRGLNDKQPAAEVLAEFYDFKAGKVIDRTVNFPFEDLSRTLDSLAEEELTDQERFARLDFDEIRRLAKLGPTYITFRNRTPTLLRVGALAELVTSNELFLKSPETFFALVSMIVEICEAIIQRTKGRYKFFADSQEYLPLDKAVLTISPIKDRQNWKSLHDQRKQVMARKALVLTPVTVEEAPVGIPDDESWQKAMDAVARRLDSARVAAEMTRAATGDMPEVNKRIANLKQVTFANVEAQTRARYPEEWRGDSLHVHVELMLYHSVFSVVLDKDGEPLFGAGFPYAFLVPNAGVPMQRRMQPPGLYASTGKLADYHLAIEKLEVKSILFGGIGGLIEPGLGFSWEHELHTRLQRHIDFMGFHVVPVIVVKEAYVSHEFSVTEAVSSFDEIIERTGRYLYAEVIRRLERLYENYEEILLDLAEQIVKEIIVDRIKEWARDYIVEKIGKKLIPGLNLISLISELADKEELDRTRAAIACVVMSVKSRRTDDLTISSKVLAKIGIDQVQEAVVQAIENQAKKVLIRKAEKTVTSKTKAKARPDKPEPPAEPEPPPAQPDPAAAKKPDASATTDPARATHDRRTQRPAPTREDIEQGRRVGEELQKAQARAKADAEAAEQKRSQTVDSKTVDGTSTDATATRGKARDTRGTPKLGKEPPEEPPVPPRTATPKEKLDFFNQNKEQYPEDIRARIEAEVAKAAERKPGTTVRAVADINKAIEAENAKGGTKYETIPKNLSAAERLEYLKQNRKNYPADVRKKIDAELKKAAAREASAGTGALAKIDAAIREDYARLLTIHYGIPVERVVRRERYGKGGQKGEDKPGTDIEKTNISIRTGKRPDLSIVSRTKDGDEVQVDDLHRDEQGKLVAREYKSSLDIEQLPPDQQERAIQGRMDRQARWAEDHNLTRYEWVYHSKEDGDKMVAAKAALLGQANKQPEGVRKKLLERYKKIVIIPDPHDE